MAGVTLAAAVLGASAVGCLVLAVAMLRRERPLTGLDALLVPGIAVVVIGQLSAVALMGRRLLDLDDTGAAYPGWRGTVFGDLPAPVVVAGIVLVVLPMVACTAALFGAPAHLVPTDDPSCQYLLTEHNRLICRSEAGKLAEQADYQRQLFFGMTGTFMLYTSSILSFAFDGGQSQRRRGTQL
jgi:hypothetical protein